MHKVLSIPYQATINLQKRDLKLSDVYGIWLKIKLGLSKLISTRRDYKTDLANHILTALGNRSDTIFSNPFMSSAVFLDPRYRAQIRSNEIKMQEAKSTLKNVWRRLIVIENLGVNDTTIDTSNTSTTSDPNSQLISDDDLDRFLLGNVENNTNVQVQTTLDIDMLLESFNPPIVSSKTDILEYWESLKDDNEELYKLATVIFSIPPTEVQIERDFSELNFVFNALRCALTKERLEDIMIINLNKDLFFTVKKERLNELKSVKKTINF